LMMLTGHATSRAAVRLLATAQMMKVLDIGYLLSLVSGLPLRQHRVPPLFIARTRR
jgi:hypothetical protein